MTLAWSDWESNGCQKPGGKSGYKYMLSLGQVLRKRVACALSNKVGGPKYILLDK